MGTKRNPLCVNEEQHKKLQEITRAHIDSFDYFTTTGLSKIVKYIDPVDFEVYGEQAPGTRLHIGIISVKIFPPRVSSSNKFALTREVYPSECRERHIHYSGDLHVSMYWACNGQYGTIEKLAGKIPIMVKSGVCNLANLKPCDLVTKGEEPEEMGGYFIIGGNEKVVRLLIQQRRNFPICFKRDSWKKRGEGYTEYGISIRCVQEDQTSNNLTLHYLQGGKAKLAFGLNKEMFYVDVILILKALMDVSDKHIFDELVKGKEEDTSYKSCVLFMLRPLLKFQNKASVLRFIGDKFRVKLNLPEWYSDEECAKYLIRKSIAIHLEQDQDKFNLLVFMTKKLFAFEAGQCAEESADNPMFQELLLPGHLMQMFLKEKLEGLLNTIKELFNKKVNNKKGCSLDKVEGDINRVVMSSPLLTRPLDYLLSTGNLISNTGLGLMQMSGFAVIADKLNFYRYISHFRAVHRGSFFTEMRTTSVRKLLPEAWGFLCPVHTPDGTPCGLLNHLSAGCQVVNQEFPRAGVSRVLTDLGMWPCGAPCPLSAADCCTVLLDGRVMGYVPYCHATTFANTLRLMKVKGKGEEVPPTLEICLVPKTQVASQMPGIYLFSTVARMMRPVWNINIGALELIGSFEQVYMDIALKPDQVIKGVHSHQELSQQHMLSVIANMTPFSDFNQSPRNMYQCQMGKQTMGTPLHAYDHRADNKLYRIQTPMTPIVKPKMYDTFNLNEYPLGTNAVVAVISYTGYDMEDAMIINKASYERGFCHGSIIKSEIIDLRALNSDHGKNALVFSSNPTKILGCLDIDGLPFVGAKLSFEQPYYSYRNTITDEYKVVIYKGQEDATVEQIKILGDDSGNEELNCVCFVLRVARNPTIGDKFSSRHGQKGVCSMFWPNQDMPFSESGMVPDILFNPHGFPSRMTIGMMIEQMAGKAGALHGIPHLDATPFTFSEDQPAIDYFGQMLTAGGYNYFGTERMYSGVHGIELEADIYFGIVYYQRLRHMVSDKFQVRTTGPVDQVTQQPIKGRKNMGGIRFGEMERDAMISHGTSFLLQDRLFNCSDKSKASICGRCHTVLSPVLVQERDDPGSTRRFNQQITCMHCQRRDDIHTIAVPYVFKYLAAELASVGIKINIEIKPDK